MASTASPSCSSQDSSPEGSGSRGAPVQLQVAVTDAQGLRLFRGGGEIRLVISLRAADDPIGQAFGNKVTPWLPAPEGQALKWKAKWAAFNIPLERAFQAEFMDGAHLHIELMQRGFAPNQPAASAGPLGGWGAALKQTAPAALGGAFSALEGASSAALKGASSVLSSASTLAGVSGDDRGEAIGVLSVPLGQRLVRAGGDGGGASEPSWVELVAGSGPEPARVKGTLLLDLIVVHPSGRGAPPAAGQPRQGEESTQGAHVGTAALTPRGIEAPEASDSAASGSGAEASDSTAATVGGPRRPGTKQVPDGVRGEVTAPRTCGSAPAGALSAEVERRWQETERQQVSVQAVSNLLAAEAQHPSVEQASPSEWFPLGRGHAQRRSALLAADPPSAVNIFTINAPVESADTAPASSSSASGSAAGVRALFGSWARPRPMQRLRVSLDPAVRKGRREVQKWRRRHEIFVILNEIERCLGDASRLLTQASGSMRQFGESHGALEDAPLLSAFLRDAALYFKSEAGVPNRLEAHLADLERVADEFRGVTIVCDGGDAQPGGAQADLAEMGAADRELVAGLRLDCVNLQVDIAVLLESALMTAQQALAEYKKMHCRLELLATEYEPLCRLELDTGSRKAFLPLLMEERVQAEALPEQAVQWALDFSHLVVAASRSLEELVRELDGRRRRVASCATELRDGLLRIAATVGAEAGDDAGPDG